MYTSVHDTDKSMSGGGCEYTLRIHSNLRKTVEDINVPDYFFLFFFLFLACYLEIPTYLFSDHEKTIVLYFANSRKEIVSTVFRKNPHTGIKKNNKPLTI